LYEAAAAGNVAEVRANLAAGVDPNQIASNGEPPLHFAAASGNPRATDLLLQAGADINAPDVRYGCTALNAAAVKGDVATAQLLLESGISLKPVEGPYGYGPSALHDAATRGDLAMIRLLFSYGAPLDFVSVEPGDFVGATRGTPLQFANRAGQTAAVTLLRQLAGTPRKAVRAIPPEGN